MEWIKFDEKMPEKDISVLVFDNGSYHIANRYGDRMYDEEGCRIEPQYWCEITPPAKKKRIAKEFVDMTREDIERMFAYQAADAAYKYAGERCHKDRPISASKLEAFEAGADWAQEFMIKRACDWLKSNLGNPKEVHPVLVNHLIENFRKAMEE